MINPKISIIILQFNNSQDTLRCLESVKEQDYTDFNVIIIDNASSVEHVNAIRFFVENELRLGSDTKYEILDAKHNLGYSGGNNFGIKHALKCGAQYVLILNPDVTLERDTLSKMFMVAEYDHRIGILGPVIDEGNRIICGGRAKFYQPELFHTECLRGFNPKSEIRNSKFYVVGACMLISKSVLQLVGMFDDRYFLYFEDADLCLRAKNAGWKLSIAFEATAYHKPSSSTKTLGSPLLLRYHYRNAHLFVLKNERCLCKYVMLPLWSAWIIIKQLIKIALIPSKRDISRAILAGVRDFYKRKFGIISN